MDTNVTSNSTFPIRSKAYGYGRYGIFFLESLLIVASNALTLVAVRRTKKLRQVAANTFVVSLAFADGIIGVLLPAIILTTLTYDKDVWIISACLFRGPYYAMFGVSLSTLLAIAVDRFIAVVRPLTYRTRMTIRRARIVSIAVWIAHLALWQTLACHYGIQISAEDYRPGAAQDLFPAKVFFLLIQLVIFLPLIGNIILYTLIYITLHKRKSVVSAGNAEENRTEKKTKAFTKMMALVLGYLIIAWLPYYIVVPLYKRNDASTPSWYVYTFDVIAIIFHSNSFVNPIIYSWQNRDFREAYRAILTCGRSPKSAPVTSEMTGNKTETVSIATVSDTNTVQRQR